jgi:hypothetical protein
VNVQELGALIRYVVPYEGSSVPSSSSWWMKERERRKGSQSTRLVMLLFGVIVHFVLSFGVFIHFHSSPGKMVCRAGFVLWIVASASWFPRRAIIRLLRSHVSNSRHVVHRFVRFVLARVPGVESGGSEWQAGARETARRDRKCQSVDQKVMSWIVNCES